MWPPKRSLAGDPHQRCGAPAESPGGGDGVLLDKPEVDVRLSDELGHEAGGAVGGMLRPAGDQLRAGAAHLDGRIGDLSGPILMLKVSASPTAS